MFRAKDTFWAPDNRRIVKGDLVAPDDPVVDGREELFEAVVIPQAVQPKKKTDDQAPTDQPPAGQTGQAPTADDDQAPAADDAGSTPADTEQAPASDGHAAPAPAGAKAPAAAKTAAKPAARKTAAAKGGTTS